MSETHALTEYHDGSGLYEIRLKGHLGDWWADRFEGLTITREANGDTLLSGPVADQAALHGLLKKVRDLGVPLVSVSPVESGKSDGPCQILNRRRQLVYAKSTTTRRKNEYNQK